MNAENSQSHPLVKAGVIAGVSCILGLLFNYFFYGKIPGIAFPLYVMLVVAGFFAIATICKKQIRKEVLWLLIPLAFFSAMIFIRSSFLLTVLNMVASVLLLLVITEGSFGENIKNFLVGQYVKIFFLPFQFVHPFIQTISLLFSSRGTHKDQNVLSQIMKGAAMAIPALFVFLLLFSSADLIFQKAVLDLTTTMIKTDTMLRSVLVLMTTCVYIGAYSYTFRKTEQQLAEQQTNKTYRVGHIESSVLLGSVNVLFFIFILIQLTYLFGGGNNISSQHFTYAEYARRGFFELMAVASISFVLLLATEKYIAKKETHHALGFKILSAALVVQIMLIMASAFTRLSLYEEAYGFTTLRVYSHAFIVWLAVIFCLLLYKIYKDRKENRFAFQVFISMILFLVAMNFLNPDAFITRRNMKRFATTEKFDVDYLNRLSDDALPDFIQALNLSNENLKTSVANKLYWRTQNNDLAPYFSHWQSLNLSRIKAEKLLHSNMKTLEQYKNDQPRTFYSERGH